MDPVSRLLAFVLHVKVELLYHHAKPFAISLLIPATLQTSLHHLFPLLTDVFVYPSHCLTA